MAKNFQTSHFAHVAYLFFVIATFILHLPFPSLILVTISVLIIIGITACNWSFLNNDDPSEKDKGGIYLFKVTTYALTANILFFTLFGLIVEYFPCYSDKLVAHAMSIPDVKNSGTFFATPHVNCSISSLASKAIIGVAGSSDLEFVGFAAMASKLLEKTLDAIANCGWVVIFFAILLLTQMGLIHQARKH